MRVYGKENPTVGNPRNRPTVHVQAVINMGELGDFLTSPAGSFGFFSSRAIDGCYSWIFWKEYWG